MATDMPLPEWARNMENPPRVTRFAGRADRAVEWKGTRSRTRFQIDLGEQSINLSIAEATAVAEMILADDE